MAHPYLSGNRAPVTHEVPLTPCAVLQGTVPDQLRGGIYVRNGSNPAPAVNTDALRPYHMFDGDGMLAGVFFDPARGPLFTSRWLRTDVLDAASDQRLARAAFPSIATLIDSRAPQLLVLLEYMRCIAVVALSWLYALWSGSKGVARISVANTAIMWWDRRALATCESGPPLRVGLPQLDTRGWWPLGGHLPQVPTLQAVFQLKSFFQEWTTAHPHIDPQTNEFVAFHASFFAPYLYYTVLPPSSAPPSARKIVRAPVPGLRAPRMMHDFGVTPTHTLMLDFPLSLDILPSARRRSITPSLTYDPSVTSRIGVLPRYAPEDVRWFKLERPGGCVFHTVNAWDSERAVEMLASRMGGPALVYAAGSLPLPPQAGTDECLLYYYRLPLDTPTSPPRPSHAFPLLALPFEFSTQHPTRGMRAQRWAWGCSFFDHPAPGPWDPYTSAASAPAEKRVELGITGYSDALAQGFKVDLLLKVDVARLIERGRARGTGENAEPVDARSAQALWDAQARGEDTGVRLLRLPPGHFAQEVTFVPRDGAADEDDGWLLTYVFDEAQLGEKGVGLGEAKSELWIVDARTMSLASVCRVALPQRVPYGLHGEWFGRERVEDQEAP